MVLQGGTLPPHLTVSTLNEPVERALRLLTKRIARSPEKKLTLGDLCKEAGVTPQHLCRLFQKDLALGPMECFQALKLEQAASRLERTEGSIAVIAEALGFSSQFYFSKAFKKAYGVSPNQYRKKFRVGTAIRPGGLIYRHHRLRHYLYENGPGKVIG
jgi:AraC-like DNA-binding protein